MKNKIYKLFNKFRSIKLDILLKSGSILLSGILISLSIIFGTGSFSLGGNSNNTASEGCSGDSKLSDDCLINYAKDLDLDEKKFSQCVQDAKFDEVITSEFKYGEEIGVNGTPALFIGKKSENKIKGFFLGGARYSDIENVLGRLEKDSVENVNKYWVGLLEDSLVGYEEQVREYFASADGGALTGQELNNAVSETIQQQRILIQTDYVLKDLEVGNGQVQGDADVVLIEFSDYECPYCKTFANDVLPDVKKNFVEGGRLQYVFRDFPLENIHPRARASANAARCAGEQGKYFEYHDKLFSL